ncbi:MAG: hypothetical protein SFH39_07750 [Candidatus Magnetobacterium sp. LHC-1]
MSELELFGLTDTLAYGRKPFVFSELKESISFDLYLNAQFNKTFVNPLLISEQEQVDYADVDIAIVTKVDFNRLVNLLPSSLSFSGSVELKKILYRIYYNIRKKASAITPYDYEIPIRQCNFSMIKSHTGRFYFVIRPSGDNNDSPKSVFGKNIRERLKFDALRTDIRGRQRIIKCEAFFDEFRHPIAVWDDTMGNIEIQEKMCKIIYEFSWYRYFGRLSLREDIYNESTPSARFLTVLVNSCLEILRASLFVPEFFRIGSSDNFIIRYIPMVRHTRIQEIIALLERIMPSDMVFSEKDMTVMRKYGVRHLLAAFTHKFAQSMITCRWPSDADQQPQSAIDAAYSSLLRYAIPIDMLDVDAIIAWLSPLTVLAYDDGEGVRGCDSVLHSQKKHNEIDYDTTYLSRTVTHSCHQEEEVVYPDTEQSPMLQVVFISSLSDIKRMVLTTLSGQITLTEKAIQCMDSSPYLKTHEVFDAYRILSGKMYKHFAYSEPLSTVLDDLLENKIVYEPDYDCHGDIIYNGTTYTRCKHLKIGNGEDPSQSFHILFDFCPDEQKIVVFASGSI